MILIKKEIFFLKNFIKAISSLKNFKGPKIVDGCKPCFMSLPLKVIPIILMVINQ